MFWDPNKTSFFFIKPTCGWHRPLQTCIQIQNTCFDLPTYLRITYTAEHTHIIHIHTNIHIRGYIHAYTHLSSFPDVCAGICSIGSQIVCNINQYIRQRCSIPFDCWYLVRLPSLTFCVTRRNCLVISSKTGGHVGWASFILRFMITLHNNCIDLAWVRFFCVYIPLKIQSYYSLHDQIPYFQTGSNGNISHCSCYAFAWSKRYKKWFDIP